MYRGTQVVTYVTETLIQTSIPCQLKVYAQANDSCSCSSYAQALVQAQATLKQTVMHAQATLKLRSSYAQVTLKLRSSYAQAMLKLCSSYAQAPVRVQPMLKHPFVPVRVPAMLKHVRSCKLKLRRSTSSYSRTCARSRYLKHTVMRATYAQAHVRAKPMLNHTFVLKL